MTPRSRRGLLPAALALVLAAGAPGAARAGEADVEDVRVACDAARVCRFDVRVAHADAGFDHYADRYEIVAPDGRVLATRVLRHPHVDEQPFTRSLGGVRVPPDVARVRVRAHDSLHGLGGQERTVEIPR